MHFRGIVVKVAYVSHAFLTTFLIGIEALTKTKTKVAADFSFF